MKLVPASSKALEREVALELVWLLVFVKFSSMVFQWQLVEIIVFPAHLGGHHITSSVEGGEDAMGIFNYREVELGIHLIWV